MAFSLFFGGFMGSVRWFGYAAFELVNDGVKILIDPWISNSLSPVKLDF